MTFNRRSLRLFGIHMDLTSRLPEVKALLPCYPVKKQFADPMSLPAK